MQRVRAEALVVEPGTYHGCRSLQYLGFPGDIAWNVHLVRLPARAVPGPDLERELPLVAPEVAVADRTAGTAARTTPRRCLGAVRQLAGLDALASALSQPGLL